MFSFKKVLLASLVSLVVSSNGFADTDDAVTLSGTAAMSPSGTGTTTTTTTTVVKRPIITPAPKSVSCVSVSAH